MIVTTDALLSAAVRAQANAELAGTWTIQRGAAPTGRGAGGITGIPIAAQ